MTMALEVNGKPYKNFTSAAVEFSLDNLARVFSFAAVSSQAVSLPFNIGQPCRVLVDGEPILTGHIEKLDINYDADSHQIEVSGRDKLGDLVDSTLEPLEIQGDITLTAVIQKVLDQLGLKTVKIINTVTGLAPFNKAEDILSADVGGGAWEFLETVARKRQVLLRSNSAGNLQIFRADKPTKNKSRLLNEIGNNLNNILAASITRDETGVFGRYIVRSQANATAANASGETTADGMTNTKGEAITAIQSAIRSTRQLVMQAENPSSNEQCTSRATWEANFRQSRQFGYSATMEGFKDASGAIWDVNQLLEVKDTFAALPAIEPLLINSVAFVFSVDSGSQTTLGLITPDSYKLENQTPKTTKKKAKNEPLVFDPERFLDDFVTDILGGDLF